jgi:hypothetical protein
MSWRDYKRLSRENQGQKGQKPENDCDQGTYVPFVPGIDGEGIITARGRVSFKEISDAFSKDPLWERSKSDSRWLVHLAETLLRWRAEV